MNLELLEKRLKAKIGKLYLSRFPQQGVENDVPNFDEDMRRLRMFQVRLREHTDLMKKRNKVISDRDEAIQELVRVRKMIDAGACITAIDAERTARETVLQEVGVSHFKDGKITSMNLRVAGVQKRRTSFAFGDSEVLEMDALRERLAKETQGSDHYVGHNLGIDFDILKKNGIIIAKRSFTDTMRVSPVVPDLRDASLVNLATHFGVDASRPHSGGNDARYNLELLLAMVEAYGTYET